MKVKELPNNRKVRRAQQALRRRHKRKLKRTWIPPLVAACMSLFSPSSTTAQSVVGLPNAEARARYMTYSEHQSDGTERMTVNAPMALVRLRPQEDLLVEGIFTYDGISGASPNYLDSVSGASGKGIQDTRYEGQLRFAKQFDQNIIGTTFFLSDEDDYKSVSGSVDFTHGIEGTDTQVSASVSHAADAVSSSRLQELQEHRDSSSAAIGFSQLLDEVSVFSSSIGFTFSQGYLTDPYKTFDSRPGMRREVVLMNRYNRYIESTDGSVHADMRLFSDDWGVNSQTFEVSYFQPVGEHWLLRPSIRYYSQHKANFYRDTFPPEQLDSIYYSADQRLGTFGSITVGFRLERSITEQLSVDFSVNKMEQRTEWNIGGGDGSQFQALHALFYGVGVYQRF